MRSYLLIMLAAVVLISCDKKNDDPKPSGKIVGRWTAVSSQTIMTVGDLSYEEYLISLGLDEATAAEYADYMEQALSLTGFFAELELKADGTFTADSEFVPQPVNGNWELSSDEKTLTLTSPSQPGVTQSGTITKLTDDDLWIEVGVDPSLLPPGTPTNFDYTGLFKYTRVK